MIYVNGAVIMPLAGLYSPLNTIPDKEVNPIMSDGDWDSTTAAEQGNYGGDEGGFDNDAGNGD